MKTLYVCKAQTTHNGAHPIEDECISMRIETPEFSDLKKQRKYFENYAKDIVDVFDRTLPGGLFDHVAAEFMLRVASHFRVSHKQANGGEQ
jgi:hypothetical protein